MTEPGYEATRSAIEAVWRIESPRLIAGLARITGDVGAAEELAQDALVIALEQWPVQGVPDGPGAWLMATAKHRAIDLVRRRASYERKLQEIGRDVAVAAGDIPGSLTWTRWTTTSATTCCGSSSSPAIRCCRPRPASPSPCGCSAA